VRHQRGVEPCRHLRDRYCALQVRDDAPQHRVGQQPDAAELDENRGVAEPREPVVAGGQLAASSR
jgi:hypothetical protein